MKKPLVLHQPAGPLDVNCYIVGCAVSGSALVIDPGGDGEDIAGTLEANGLKPAAVVNTHGHFDHIGGNAFLLSRYPGIGLHIHEQDLPLLRQAALHAEYWGMPFQSSPEPTHLLHDGDVINFGELSLKVVHTPGHSPGGVSLYCKGHVFTGDTLFSGSIGRTDLPGGDHDLLISSIKEGILTLPSVTVVHPGHGPETTVGEEKLTNPFLQ